MVPLHVGGIFGSFHTAGPQYKPQKGFCPDCGDPQVPLIPRSPRLLLGDGVWYHTYPDPWYILAWVCPQDAVPACTPQVPIVCGVMGAFRGCVWIYRSKGLGLRAHLSISLAVGPRAMTIRLPRTLEGSQIGCSYLSLCVLCLHVLLGAGNG